LFAKYIHQLIECSWTHIHTLHLFMWVFLFTFLFYFVPVRWYFVWMRMCVCVSLSFWKQTKRSYKETTKYPKNERARESEQRRRWQKRELEFCNKDLQRESERECNKINKQTKKITTNECFLYNISFIPFFALLCRRPSPTKLTKATKVSNNNNEDGNDDVIVCLPKRKNDTRRCRCCCGSFLISCRRTSVLEKWRRSSVANDCKTWIYAAILPRRRAKCAYALFR